MAKRFDNDVKEQNGCTIILDSDTKESLKGYHETPLLFPNPQKDYAENAIPPKIRQMCAMYKYGRDSFRMKCKNFYNQGMFMEDYKDDYPWSGEFFCYFPTYHDLSVKQLRGYFSWRTKVRKGIFEPIAISAAYLYLYELINGIGVDDPVDGLQKLKAFETGYLDTGMGDRRMITNIHHWMLEYSVIHDIPAGFVKDFIDPKLLLRETNIVSLRNPEKASDEAIFSALCNLGNSKLKESPVIMADSDRGMHLFAEAWRYANTHAIVDGKNLFAQCFGDRSAFAWYPLSNAVYYGRRIREYREYRLTETMDFFCHRGHWYKQSYERLTFDKDLLCGFIHATDLMLRKYLKTGHGLREKQDEAWAQPYINDVIEADKRQTAEASKPKIHIDLSELDRIRQDARSTCNSLLTEDLMESDEDEGVTKSEIIPEPSVIDVPVFPEPEIPLTDIQRTLLTALLHGESVDNIIKSNHLMPSLVADEINEALLDEIGDTVIVCEDDKLSLVEDYIEDLEQLLGETA